MILSPNFDILFLLISVCTIFASLMVIFNKNPLHSILFLILVFANMSLLLLIQKIEFLSLIILMVYIGAIAVLFLFVIYMLNIKIIELNEMNSSYLLGISLVLLIVFFELLINFLFYNSDNQNVAYTANLFVED
jgi:NADH:ubiquinone oxidoreductase subunit 6 (subunit J)